MKLRNLLLMLLSFLLLPSCKDMTKGKGMAEAAIVDFHQKFNEQKFKELYVASHADMKGAATEDKFVKLLETVHSKLGAQVKSSSAGWKVYSMNLKTSVIITVKTEFEHGTGTETFTYIVSGNSCTLKGYHIDSQDMLTK